jgi:short-subunit dehydrogenase
MNAGKKVVLISGANRGIGRALCLEALSRGYEVHGLARKADLVPAGVQVHLADLRDRPTVARIMKELAPTLDLYLANAGVGHDLNPSKPDTAEKAAEIMDINGTATIYSIYALAYEWIHLKLRDKRVAVVSSLAAGIGLPKTAVYAASKTAQLIVCQGLEHDLARNGIEVTAIQPGFIETEMSEHLPERPFLMTPEAAAKKIFDGLERGSHRIVFPASTASLAWIANHVPAFIKRRAINELQKKKVL